MAIALLRAWSAALAQALTSFISHVQALLSFLNHWLVCTGQKTLLGVNAWSQREHGKMYQDVVVLPAVAVNAGGECCAAPGL